MSWFKRKVKSDDRLLGRWIVDPSDNAALAALGQVSLEFDDQGNLNYIIVSEEKSQVVLLTYRVDGTTIITDQPSHSSEQRTIYVIDGDRLTLSFDGEPSNFIRPPN